jgi:stress response protein YsnF
MDNMLVAVYPSRNEAERARDRLIAIGLAADDIRMTADGSTAVGTVVAEPRRESFWDRLFGRNVPELERSWYESNLRQGRTVLSVTMRDPTERRRVAEILEEFDPIDFDESGSRYRDIESPTTSAAPAGAARPETALGTGLHTGEGLGSPEAWQRERDTAAGSAAGGMNQRAEALGEGEKVIPAVKEDVSIGKRMSERRYRIRTYTIETPIERDVSLTDERVVVERRPASEQSAATRLASEMPADREYEVIERHEEPDVQKNRQVEEVVVRKERQDRTETIRDTARETKVDVEQDSVPQAQNR